ncbi:MAG: conjugal transfer protein TraI, partial [Pseudomonadota bacterium]
MKKASEFAFRPRLGRIRSGGNSKRARSFLSRVTRSMARAGATGGRKGRGRRTGNAPGARRVIVKARIVRMSASSAGALAEHVRYISRHSAMEEKDQGKLFNAVENDVDREQFQARAQSDRHHFRFIVSPEDGDKMRDLKPFIRDLMKQISSDLGTELDWVAVDHHNTGHSHTHIVIRGKNARGKDLVIAKNYLTAGIRGRA